MPTITPPPMRIRMELLSINCWAIAKAKIAIIPNIVSTNVAPKPVMNPDLCPSLNDFCSTNIAIGPNGAEAHIPISKPLSMSRSISLY